MTERRSPTLTDTLYFFLFIFFAFFAFFFVSPTFDQLLDLQAGKYAYVSTTIRIFDCRFIQEYSGGHIAGAVHVNGFSDLQRIFAEDMMANDRRITVFYCEFSKHRAPSM